MRIAVRAALALLLALAGLLIAAPAQAAGITITSPASGTTLHAGGTLSNDDTWYVTVSGNFDPINDGTDFNSIAMFIDGKLLVPPGSTTTDPAAQTNTQYYAATRTGNSWTFSFTKRALTIVGATFLGKRTVEARQYHSAPGERIQFVSAASITITVQEPLASASPTPGPTAPVAPAASGGLGSGKASAPSVLSSLPTAQHLGLTPGRALLTAALTVILLLLVGFPGQLIGSTVSENYDRIFGWTRPIAAGVKKAGASIGRLPNWLVVTMGVALAAVISGFVDPSFGFNLGSLRLLAEFFLSFLVQNVLGWWIVGRLVRRTDPVLKPVVEFKVLSLLIVIVAVVVSRLTGFEPGMVFGLILGLSFGASLAATRKARVALAGVGYSIALGLVAWGGYSIVTAAAGGAPNAGGVFVEEVLSGLAVSGLATLPIALLPLAVLEGGAIYAWKKWVWAVAYGVGLFAFLAILLPLPFSWGTVHAPLIVWIALYAGYALTAVGLWAWFRFRPVKSSPNRMDAQPGS